MKNITAIRNKFSRTMISSPFQENPHHPSVVPFLSLLLHLEIPPCPFHHHLRLSSGSRPLLHHRIRAAMLASIAFVTAAVSDDARGAATCPLGVSERAASRSAPRALGSASRARWSICLTVWALFRCHWGALFPHFSSTCPCVASAGWSPHRFLPSCQ